MTVPSIAIVDTLPLASASYRGQMFRLLGGEGQPDRIVQCVKLTDETYAWADLIGGEAASVAWTDVTGKPSTFPPAAHDHDDRYYTETEINAALAAKAALAGATFTGSVGFPGGAMVKGILVNGGILNPDTVTPADLTINSPTITDAFGAPEWQGDTGLDVASINGLEDALADKADTTALHSHANKSILDNITAAFTTAYVTIIDTLLGHAASTTNPHGVTKGQVGLGSVPNVDATARANHTGTQAISTVVGLQSALDGKAATGHTHAAGAIVSGTLAPARLPVQARNEANATVTASTTSTTGTTMHSSMGVAVGANEVWVIDATFTGGSFAAGGIKLGLDSPSGDLKGTVQGRPVGGADWAASSIGAAGALTALAFAPSSLTDELHLTAHVWTGATGGTVIPRLAAATSGQTASIGNATLLAWRVA